MKSYLNVKWSELNTLLYIPKLSLRNLLIKMSKYVFETQ